MRMWMVSPRLLCRQHLLGEHAEIHKHRHIFVKQYSVAGRVGQIEPKSMQARHDELAVEMKRRNYKHQSPYAQPDISHLPDMTVDREKALLELRRRCAACRKRGNA